MLRLLLITLFCGASLAHADTYKWVDANGVVNYSNTPPPEAGKAQTIADRVSSYQAEPAVANPIDVYRRLDADQRDWLQRQQIMAMQPAAPAPVDDYYGATYYPAYGYAHSRRAFRPVVFNAVRAIAPRPAPRAALRGF
jgi:hypothetical protein